MKIERYLSVVSECKIEIKKNNRYCLVRVTHNPTGYYAESSVYLSIAKNRSRAVCDIIGRLEQAKYFERKEENEN